MITSLRLNGPGNNTTLEYNANEKKLRWVDWWKQQTISRQETWNGAQMVAFPTTIQAEEARAVLDISRMFPAENTGSCPMAAECIHVAEISLCEAPLRSAVQNGTCLIYNFGVGETDAFLSFVGKQYPECQVFAFDPTVSEATWAKQGGSKQVFGENVHFYSWGLYGGVGPRTSNWSHPVYGHVTGELYTISEIVSKLGHNQKRFSVFRSDCEGCEWAWVNQTMQEHPSFFNRIDQMFIEAHLSTKLRFDDTALHQAPMFQKMVVNNFVVMSSRVNLGGPQDQWHVPEALVNIGVNAQACCRELGLVSKHLF